MIANRRNVARRRGLTLVELLAAFSTLTIVLAMCVALMTMLLKLSVSGRDGLANDVAIARLARLFREDVRWAREVRRVDEGKPSQRIALISNEMAVEYSANGDRLERIEWDGDELVQQERLTLPKSSSPRFERRTDSERGVVVLVLDRAAKSPGVAKVREFRIEATTGAAHRFEAGGPRR